MFRLALCADLALLALCQLTTMDKEQRERLIAEQFDRCGPETETQIAHCMEPMLAYANAIQQSSEGEEEVDADAEKMTQHHHHSTRQHFSLQGGAVFRRLCTLYEQFKECTRGAQVRCASVAERAVDASYGFMCGPAGHAQFARHADCFAAVETRADYLHCKRDASRAMDRVTGEQRAVADGGGDEQRALCEAMQDYLRCCRPLVMASCGPDAWRLVARITRESLHVSLPECDLQHALQQQH